MTSIADTIGTEGTIKDTLAKLTKTAGAERTPEQQEALRKRWELAQEFERYLSKWMAIESIELGTKGVTHQTFMSAMSEALSASLTKMVVLAGWSDDVAVSAFAGCLKDYRKELTEQIDALKTDGETNG